MSKLNADLPSEGTALIAIDPADNNLGLFVGVVAKVEGRNRVELIRDDEGIMLPFGVYRDKGEKSKLTLEIFTGFVPETVLPEYLGPIILSEDGDWGSAMLHISDFAVWTWIRHLQFVHDIDLGDGSTFIPAWRVTMGATRRMGAGTKGQDRQFYVTFPTDTPMHRRVKEDVGSYTRQLFGFQRKAISACFDASVGKAKGIFDANTKELEGRFTRW